MDEKSWHGVPEHLVGEFWVILLTTEPPSQTKTLAHIESNQLTRPQTLVSVQTGVFKGMGEDVEAIESYWS